jgi:hypothetical protein
VTHKVESQDSNHHSRPITLWRASPAPKKERHF